jgi:hypothetical protein
MAPTSATGDTLRGGWRWRCAVWWVAGFAGERAVR